MKFSEKAVVWFAFGNSIMMVMPEVKGITVDGFELQSDEHQNSLTAGKF